jgi:hypothetical protein
MEIEAYTFAREDMTAHRLVDLRNQVVFDTRKTEQMLAKVGDDFDPAERARIVAAMADLRRLAETSGDPDAVHKALRDFDRLTVRLAETAITKTLKEEAGSIRPTEPAR